MTLRSVCGVKAPPGRPALELFAGVVAGLFVVRSALGTQIASASVSARAANTSLHPACAVPGNAVAAHAAATTDNPPFGLICLPLGAARIAHLPRGAKSD